MCVYVVQVAYVLRKGRPAPRSLLYQQARVNQDPLVSQATISTVVARHQRLSIAEEGFVEAPSEWGACVRQAWMTLSTAARLLRAMHCAPIASPPRPDLHLQTAAGIWQGMQTHLIAILPTWPTIC